MTTTTGNGTAVDLAGVGKSFGRAGRTVRAVDGIDLSVARGETVALLGRNGAGKSTTIGLLLGLDEPDTGRVRVLGRSAQQAVRAGLVGAMLQDGQPIQRVTVRELVAFVASTYPKPMPVAEALSLAGLSEYADRRVDKLSGGQVQRVRFAVALAGNPELIVLDEPTAALDVEARRAFWGSMRAYARRGNTVLFSTHYLEEADGNADRIVVVDRGRIVADGTGDALRSSVGSGLVSFDLAGGPTGGLELLPGVVAVEVAGDRALLRTDDSDATVVELARRGMIRDLRVSRATLEDAFLALTSPAAPSTSSDSEAEAV
ncbi:ABC transporter ATP-binding protein [Streptomyces sp. NPDC001777]|uniref:ABC transporter ATP-binding protein n=1 Tax=Streptomyces sp. NPDC001777 TaxID=3364608 RepID=UPI0036749366